MDNNTTSTFETLSDAVFDQLMSDAPPKPVVLDNASKVVTPKADTPPDPTPVKTPEELEKELDDANGEQVVADTTSTIDTAAILKAQAQGLIERGLWQEFEGMEDFEYTEENYGKLAEIQATWKAEEKYSERVGKTGDIGKSILEYVENGGDPNEIVELFKAAKRIETFDTKTDAGKESLIKEYYTKVLNWTEAKTTRYIKTLVDESPERVAEEANEVKGLMDKGIQDQLKEAQEAQKQARFAQEAQAKAWETNMRKIITSREDLSDAERRDVQDTLLNYNIKLQDGRIVNKFMVKFMEVQSDPQKYIDLVRFVMNPDKYKEKLDKKADDKAARKGWEFIKGGQALSKSTGTSHVENKSATPNLTINYKQLAKDSKLI